MLKAFRPLIMKTLPRVRMSQLSTTSTTETVKTSYVVYLYVDYRKEIGARVIRTYFNRQKAIEFAESLSTKYEKEEEEEEEEKEEELQADYAVFVGTEFDSCLRFPYKRLIEFGLREEDASRLWRTRVAVDSVQHFDD